jgi:DNA polymerase III epsilon subunit-like protein
MTGIAGNFDLSRIAFVDLEASGLTSPSYPTEIGWAIVREDGLIESGSCLIKPPAKWTRYSNAWSAASERLTGITMKMLENTGLAPREALARFLDAVANRDLFSDQPDFDNHWLGMLAEAAGVPPGMRKISDIQVLLKGRLSNFQTVPASQHRAEPDARRLALAVASVLRDRGK